MPMIPLNGLSSSQIAEKYNAFSVSVRKFARAHDLPYISSDGGKTIDFYVFDKAAEEMFINRRGRGRPTAPKPPKIPKKMGRPRKEKPKEDLAPKMRGKPKKIGTQ